ncbi:sensor domain-containing diguanylate cyclase [Pseudoalteromonas sp. NEC-BIFX-2020_002]|uniref:sensor domain-containing diguanylate cyclase n=1 Tax=Pseudoalteromonas sp. NEC-BIFX-2020_002 TaxID=2732353 RepID=UPI0014772419|nr:sensor domain-containing diguanylate cyclase [Pseudoalteromonas sp. NEC-BIFX-2020_002]NNG43821.1 sensor domain-containing diguanylate cyclase [Pseudoalteromonas sp. NEC-BIFX-2020_002]
MDYVLYTHSLISLIDRFAVFANDEIDHMVKNTNSDLRTEAFTLFEALYNQSTQNGSLLEELPVFFISLDNKFTAQQTRNKALSAALANWWLEWSFVYSMQAKVITNSPVTVQNITHLTQGNTQPMRQHELSHYANLFTQVPIPLCNVSTVTGDIIRLNQRFVDVFGYTIKDIPNMDTWWLKAYPDPAYRSWVLQTWNTAVEYAVEHKTDIEPQHYQVTCKDGRLITMEISGIYIDNEFLAIFKDATQRMEAEDILRDMAFLDSLTQIANRRRFDEKLIQEFNLSIKTNSPLSLILIDIDNFKQFNDSYGHLIGDECLLKVAQCISTAVSRPEDFVARFGGEEFVVLLPQTSAAGACNVAQKIQHAISELTIIYDHCFTNKVTLSLGINTRYNQCDHIQLLDGADKALYKAKEHGRDCIVVNQ